MANILKSVLSKISKTIGLLTIHEAFARPHLDFGDSICEQAFNESFHQRIESIQNNAAILITGAIRGTSSKKFSRVRLTVTTIQMMAQETLLIL